MLGPSLATEDTILPATTALRLIPYSGVMERVYNLLSVKSTGECISVLCYETPDETYADYLSIL